MRAAQRQVGPGLGQLDVLDQLHARREQRARDRLGVAQLVLQEELPPEFLALVDERPLVERRVDRLALQHVQHDVIGFDERAQHGVRHAEAVDRAVNRLRIAPLFEQAAPIRVDPVHLLGKALLEGRSLAEEELEFQRFAQPDRGLPEGRLARAGPRFGSGHHRQFADRALENEVQHRIAVERGGQMLPLGDRVNRFQPLVEARDDIGAYQFVEHDTHVLRRIELRAERQRLPAIARLPDEQAHVRQDPVHRYSALAGGQQGAGDDGDTGDRRHLIRPPGDREAELLERQALLVVVGIDVGVRRAERRAHRQRLAHAQIDLALRLAHLAQALEHPGQVLRLLGFAQRLAREARDFHRLVVDDGDGDQHQILAMPLPIGIGGIGQQPHLGWQQLARARPGSFGEPLQVEALLDQVAEPLAQGEAIDRIVGYLAAQEHPPGAAHQRPHRPERHVDAGEQRRRRQVLLGQHRFDHRAVEIGLVRRQQDHRVSRESLPQHLDLLGIDVALAIGADVHPAERLGREVEHERIVRGPQLVEIGERLGPHARLATAELARKLREAGAEAGRAGDVLLIDARHFVARAADSVFGAFERQLGLARDEAGEIARLRLLLGPGADLPTFAQVAQACGLGLDHLPAVRPRGQARFAPLARLTRIAHEQGVAPARLVDAVATRRAPDDAHRREPGLVVDGGIGQGIDQRRRDRLVARPLVVNDARH